jgi:hypothetical protein
MNRLLDYFCTLKIEIRFLEHKFVITNKIIMLNGIKYKPIWFLRIIQIRVGYPILNKDDRFDRFFSFQDYVTWYLHSD